MATLTVGQYLAQRLEELGLADYFAIPGDFNLALLDEMLKHPRLRMINCCNCSTGPSAGRWARVSASWSPTPGGG